MPAPVAPRLHHLAITVTDLDASVTWYEQVFGIQHRSIEDLLETMAAVEPGLAPPISVRLHGDFNTNNVVFDAATDRVHFIDVHRSGNGDYVQDVGVFLVSNVRHPIQDAALRAALMRINRQVRDFAAEFARLTGDVHFASRLMLSDSAGSDGSAE